MRVERATQILGHLRDGEDPRTGKPLPPGSPCQDPDVVRALYTVLGALAGHAPAADATAAAEAAPAKPERARPPRVGERWTPEEDERLARGFDAGRTDRDLATELGRTRYAVRMRLVKLGKIPAERPEELAV